MKKTVLVTGASGNLGSAMVKKCLERGFRIAAFQNTRESEGGDVSGQIEHFAVDLTDELRVKELLEEVYARFECIDLAVLTVGGFAMGGLADTSLEDLDRMYHLNFITAFNVARRLIAGMEKQQGEGQMVFIGTKPALHPEMAKNMVAYSLSKSLLFRLAEVVNEEGKNRGISASVFVPGTMDTPQNRSAMPDADSSKWVSPEKVAESILSLITPAGKGLKGKIIEV